MWLKVDRTNNNPEVTAGFFLNCVDELGGCPTLLRTDCGTENVIIAATQCFLRDDDDDDNDEFAGEKSHRYGASTMNQRVEAWWSYLRHSRLTWWINFFKDLVDSGTLFSGNTIHVKCLWFCFAEIIQKDLDFVCLHWNTHYIRKSGYDTIPGKPDELYFLPANSNAPDYLQPVSCEKLEEARAKCATSKTNDYQDYFNEVLSLLGVAKLTHWKEALDLFLYLTGVAL